MTDDAVESSKESSAFEPATAIIFMKKSISWSYRLQFNAGRGKSGHIDEIEFKQALFELLFPLIFLKLRGFKGSC